MKVGLIHNYYRQYGGEDAIFESECRLLKDFGCNVVVYSQNNKDIEQFSPKDRLNLLANWSWQKENTKTFKQWLSIHQPDVVHCHNIFYLISPGIHQACQDLNIPVVQNLNNFRLFCINGLLFRDGKVCEDCKTTKWKAGVQHKCFQNSKMASWLFSKNLKRLWDSSFWTHMVDGWVVPTQFTADKYQEFGFEAENFFLKPNVIYPFQQDDMKFPRQDYVLYLGRLSEEKGSLKLLESWKSTSVNLKLIGNGPLAEQIKGFIVSNKMSHVDLLGFLSKEEVMASLKQAKALVISSECYENFPCVVIEAMASGLPIIAPDHGSFREIIQHQQNGYLFPVNNFSRAIEYSEELVKNASQFDCLSQQAYQTYQNQYTPQKCFDRLMNIYQSVIQQKKQEVVEV